MLPLYILQLIHYDRHEGLPKRHIARGYLRGNWQYIINVTKLRSLPIYGLFPSSYVPSFVHYRIWSHMCDWFINIRGRLPYGCMPLVHTPSFSAIRVAHLYFQFDVFESFLFSSCYVLWCLFSQFCLSSLDFWFLFNDYNLGCPDFSCMLSIIHVLHFHRKKNFVLLFLDLVKINLT